MSNYHVEPVDRPQALSGEAIKSLRRHQVKGISRRQLLRYSIGLEEEARVVERAVRLTVDAGTVTRDVAGGATTRAVTEQVIAHVLAASGTAGGDSDEHGGAAAIERELASTPGDRLLPQ